MRHGGETGIESIPPKLQFFCSEICLFWETKDIILIKKRDHEIAISVGHIAGNTHPVNSVFDIGAGPCPIREDFLEAESLKTQQSNN